MQDKSFLTQILKTVSNLPWLKNTFDPFVKTSDHPKSVADEDFADIANILFELSEDEFKTLIHKIFKQRGYSIKNNTDEQHNNISLVLLQDNESTYVQYEYWKEKQIDVPILSDLYVAMELDNIKLGIVICSGSFSQEALDFSLGKKLLLINGLDLSHMIGLLMKSIAEGDSEVDKVASMDDREQQMPELEPLCPICSQKMIKRTAKKGKNAGNTFWGCSKFPNCRGVVSE